MMPSPRRRSVPGDARARVMLILAAAVCLTGSLYLSYHHEPDNETVTFSTDTSADGHTEYVTSSARTYLFQFTGEDADSVHWDFGDGTSADAFEVYKTYAGPGTYNVLCTAMNFGGTRVSGMPITIEEREFGFFTGYSDELLLLSLGILFMIFSYTVGTSRVSDSRRRRKW